MPELGDLRLDKSAETAEPQTRILGLNWMLLAVIAVVIAIAGYLVLRRPAPAAPSTAKPQARVSNDIVLAPEHGENIPLPPLDESDSLVRELVGRLSSHPKVVAWLTTDRLIRNFTIVLVNVAEGHTPAGQLHVLAPRGSFQTSADSGTSVILPASFARYDSLADAFASLDARGAARLYATLKPRIQEAYRDLGYPTGDVDDVVKKAIVELLKTPVLEEQIPVKHSSVSYTYADPRLESLSGAQKHLLRMGPRNVRIVQAKLREIAPALGIDPATLPSAPSR
jgi:Protein of unknown function (DUF3014)